MLDHRRWHDGKLRPDKCSSVNVVFGWRCVQCNLDGHAPSWDTSQEELDQHWRTYHGRPIPEGTELVSVSHE